jgi:hypothetical protein
MIEVVPKPCPFCGSQVTICEAQRPYSEAKVFFCLCLNSRCEAEGPKRSRGLAAVKAWHRRLSASDLDAALANLDTLAADARRLLDIRDTKLDKVRRLVETLPAPLYSQFLQVLDSEPTRPVRRHSEPVVMGRTTLDRPTDGRKATGGVLPWEERLEFDVSDGTLRTDRQEPSDEELAQVALYAGSGELRMYDWDEIAEAHKARYRRVARAIRAILSSGSTESAGIPNTAELPCQATTTRAHNPGSGSGGAVVAPSQPGDPEHRALAAEKERDELREKLSAKEPSQEQAQRADGAHTDLRE